MAKKRTYPLQTGPIGGHSIRAAGHHVGGSFRVEGEMEQLQCEPLSRHAFVSMPPKRVAMCCRANVPWLEDKPGVPMHLCADAKDLRAFRSSRLRVAGGHGEGNSDRRTPG